MSCNRNLFDKRSDEYHEAMRYGAAEAAEREARQLAYEMIEEARETARDARKEAHEALSNLYDLETEMSILLQYVSGVLRIQMEVYGVSRGILLTKQDVDEALKEILESKPSTLTDMTEMAKKIGSI